MEVRPATLDDASAIAGVHIDSWRGAYERLVPASFLASLDLAERTQRWSRHLRSPQLHAVVAVDSSSVIGFCTLQSTRDDDKTVDIGEIPTIFILPTHWRRGVGRLLVDAALDEARQRAYSAVTLWTLEANVRAHAFYEALGFTQDGASKTVDKAPGVKLDVIRYCILIPSKAV